jgi:hypothetical protein
MTLVEKAQLLANMAENARVAGDTKASLELAFKSAQLLQLIRIWQQQK